MQIRLLIFGVLVHGLLLLWSYDMYCKPEHVEVSCPLLNDSKEFRRIILVIVRNPGETDAIEGLGRTSFSNIPSVFYFGESILPEYYNSSQNWIKNTFPISWDNLREDSLNIFPTFTKHLHELNDKQVLFFVVVHSDLNERIHLYLKHELESAKDAWNQLHDDSKTTFLLYFEQIRSLWSTGYRSVHLEEKLRRSADLVPLLTTLLAVPIPYQSIAVLPLGYLNFTRDKAIGLYCNALHTVALAQKNSDSVGVLKYVTKTKIITTLVSNIRGTIERLYSDRNYTGALYLSKNLLNISLSSYITSKEIVSITLLLFVLISLIGWMIVLCTEYLQMTSCNNYVPPARHYMIHLPFVCVSLIMTGIPFLQKWPHSYHAYFQLPVLIIWLIFLRIRCLPSILWKRESLKKFLLFLSVLLLAEEYTIIEQEIVVPISVCAVALYPSLPKYRTVPFILIMGWFLTSAMLLGATFVVKKLEPNTKYINLSGTIWLLLAGISILWASPKRDKILICLVTVCLGAVMWLQNACFSSYNICHILIYCTWSVFAIILIPLLGKSNALNKILQCSIAFAVPIVLTSTMLEPLAFLIILGFTACWSLIESYYSIASWDNLRRMLIIIYLFMLTEKLTATDSLSFKCLICELNLNTKIYTFILSLVRLLIMYSCVLITYRLIVGSYLQCYTSIILASLVLSFASLRLLLPLTKFTINSDNLDNYLYKHVRINTKAIILILSYNVAMIYARNNKHLAIPSKQSIEMTAL